jgi:hypothetical protein
MAISRLAISNPGATTDTLLHTATRSSLVSIIATNKASTVAEVRVWIIPTGQDATPANWSYIAYDADITATNSLETFRFPVMTGDKIYVRSTTADVSFQIMGIYETGADTYVYAQSTQPTAPQIGDIWVDTASDVPSIDNTTVYRWSKTAVGGETSLSGAGNDLSTLQYIAGYEQVYLNGVLLAKTLDYTATNGTSITSLAALSAGDIVEVISPYAIELTDVYTKSVSDSKYQTKSSSGLNLIVPSSVVAGTGTATVTANGEITFSGASHVTINNCFSANYDTYKVIISNLSITTSGQLLQYQMSSGGTAVSTSTYSHQRIYAQNTTIGTAMSTSQQSCGLSYIGTSALNYVSFEIMNPFLSTVTKSISQGNYSDPTNPFYFEQFSGYHSTAASYDGIRIIPGANAISGKIRIYGYNNGGA